MTPVIARRRSREYKQRFLANTNFWPRPPERPYPDLILKKLRTGDIHTHVPEPILDLNSLDASHDFPIFFTSG